LADAAIIVIRQRRLWIYSVVKGHLRVKQLIRKELVALTVRLWDWVRFV